MAEVLITLGIIGVVAALTMPSLIAKHQEKVTVTKLKKAYSVLAQAYTMASAEYGPPQDWGIKPKVAIKDDDDNIIDYDMSGIEVQLRILSKYMKGKRCDNLPKCFGKSSITLYNLSKTDAGELTDSTIEIFPKFLLDDGTVIQFTNAVSASCTSKWTNDKSIRCSDIEVYIQNGKDMQRGVNNFMFNLTREGILPTGGSDNVTYSFANSCTVDKSNKKGTNGHGCTAWVLYNENMDYLHCDDLAWGGKRKCH